MIDHLGATLGLERVGDKNLEANAIRRLSRRTLNHVRGGALSQGCRVGQVQMQVYVAFVELSSSWNARGRRGLRRPRQ